MTGVQTCALPILGMCERSFRRYVSRYEADGLEGLVDQRLEQASNRRAPVDEVMALTTQYQTRHSGWNVKHFHGWYKREGGTRSYTWVKRRLQEAKLAPKAERHGVHRKRRERSPLPGLMIHQDGSTHAWVPDQQWDLIVKPGRGLRSRRLRCTPCRSALGASLASCSRRLTQV